MVRSGERSPLPGKTRWAFAPSDSVRAFSGPPYDPQNPYFYDYGTITTGRALRLVVGRAAALARGFVSAVEGTPSGGGLFGGVVGLAFEAGAPGEARGAF